MPLLQAPPSMNGASPSTLRGLPATSQSFRHPPWSSSLWESPSRGLRLHRTLSDEPAALSLGESDTFSGNASYRVQCEGYIFSTMPGGARWREGLLHDPHLALGDMFQLVQFSAVCSPGQRLNCSLHLFHHPAQLAQNSKANPSTAGMMAQHY